MPTVCKMLALICLSLTAVPFAASGWRQSDNPLPALEIAQIDPAFIQER